MYNGLSAGNQQVLITLVGSSETTRGNHIQNYKVMVRYSPVKYESTYVCWLILIHRWDEVYSL